MPIDLRHFPKSKPAIRIPFKEIAGMVSFVTLGYIATVLLFCL